MCIRDSTSTGGYSNTSKNGPKTAGFASANSTDTQTTGTDSSTKPFFSKGKKKPLEQDKTNTGTDSTTGKHGYSNTSRGAKQTTSVSTQDTGSAKRSSHTNKSTSDKSATPKKRSFFSEAKQRMFGHVYDYGKDGESQSKDSHHQTNTSNCLLYTSPSPRDATLSRMPSSA